MNGKELLDILLQDLEDIGKEDAGRFGLSVDEIKKRLVEAYKSGLLSLRAETFENVRRKILAAVNEYARGLCSFEETTCKLDNFYKGLASSAVEEK